MSKHRIALLGPSLEAVSGVTTHVRMLLASDLAREYDLLHFQVGSEGRRENAPQKLARFVVSPLHLGLVLVRSGADAVHFNTSLDPKAYWRDLVYWLVARLLGRRVVNQVHGGAMPQDFFRGNAFLTWILRRFLVSSDVVTVLSKAELAAYRAFDPRMKVHLIPNAIDPAGLADQRRAPNADRPLRLVYVGRLVRAKGLFEVIEALAQLQRAGREFTLSIAGGGQDQAELTAAAQRAGLGDRVRFIGSVFGTDKYRLWLDSDVFVFPSYMEGLPYSLLEAMAAGCVPITTPVAAIPDVMRHGEHGLFVPVKDAGAIADAIATLDDDRSRMARMAVAARQRVLAHYTVARLADDLRKLYRSSLAASARGAARMPAGSPARNRDNPRLTRSTGPPTRPRTEYPFADRHEREKPR
jgi:glycosyltransferase involved in cell wall biosynthesis